MIKLLIVKSTFLSVTFYLFLCLFFYAISFIFDHHLPRVISNFYERLF